MDMPALFTFKYTFTDQFLESIDKEDAVISNDCNECNIKPTTMHLSKSENVEDDLLNRCSTHRTRIRSSRGVVKHSTSLADALMQAGTVEEARYSRQGRADDAQGIVSHTRPCEHSWSVRWESGVGFQDSIPLDVRY